MLRRPWLLACGALLIGSGTLAFAQAPSSSGPSAAQQAQQWMTQATSVLNVPPDAPYYSNGTSVTRPEAFVSSDGGTVSMPLWPLYPMVAPAEASAPPPKLAAEPEPAPRPSVAPPAVTAPPPPPSSVPASPRVVPDLDAGDEAMIPAVVTPPSAAATVTNEDSGAAAGTPPRWGETSLTSAPFPTPTADSGAWPTWMRALLLLGLTAVIIAAAALSRRPWSTRT